MVLQVIYDRDQRTDQVQSHNIEKDMNVFNQYNKHRTDFLVNTLHVKNRQRDKNDNTTSIKEKK